MLWMVEDLIRTMKQTLETRPIYHRRDETIRGPVFCRFLALALKFELERRLREQDASWEWAEVLRSLHKLQGKSKQLSKVRPISCADPCSAKPIRPCKPPVWLRLRLS